jgi:hypothetical protein
VEPPDDTPPPPLVPSGALPAGEEQAEAHNISGAEADATARTQRTSVFIKSTIPGFLAAADES